MRKSKRDELARQRIAAMSKEEMRTEFIATLVGSVMPLIEKVVKRRVEQWFDEITDQLGVGICPKKP